MRVISSSEAPKVIGPYSHAIKVGHTIYCSGQIGINPASGFLAGADIASQTKQALHNLQSVLAEAGSDFSHVAKVTIFLKDLNDYAAVNELYAQSFPDIKPARSAVQASRLPKDALIEIECIAYVK